MWRKDYYVDTISDLDESLWKDVEQRFAHVYPDLVDHSFKARLLTGARAVAAIDWVASLLSRTHALATVIAAIESKGHSTLSARAAQEGMGATRMGWYTEMRDLMTRPLWQWKVIRIRDAQMFVLTDNPAVLVRGFAPDLAVIAPISRSVALIGGAELPCSFPPDLITRLNLRLLASSLSRTYAADREYLEYIVRPLSADTAWAHAARKPLGGLPERILKTRSPVGCEAEVFWRLVKDRLGPAPMRRR